MAYCGLRERNQVRRAKHVDHATHSAGIAKIFSYIEKIGGARVGEQYCKMRARDTAASVTS